MSFTKVELIVALNADSRRVAAMPRNRPLTPMDGGLRVRYRGDPMLRFNSIHIYSVLALLTLLVSSCAFGFPIGALKNPASTEIEMHAWPDQRMAYARPVRSYAPPSGDNYIASISAEGLDKWDMRRMPVKVFIQDGSSVYGYRPSFRPLMKKALDEWCAKTGGLLSWQEVSNPRAANIVCVWNDEPNMRGRGLEAGNTQTITERSPFGGVGNIRTAKVSILTQLGGRSFSDAEMYKTCLHEIGHAFGLAGHAEHPGDIMYPSINRAQVPYLTARDVNTMVALYLQNSAPTYGRYDPYGGTARYAPGPYRYGVPAQDPMALSGIARELWRQYMGR